LRSRPASGKLSAFRTPDSVLRATDIQCRSTGRGFRLEASIVCAAQSDPFPLRFEAGGELDLPPPPWPGDVLLCALLLPAMRRGEPLRLDAPLSPRLRESLPTLQAILSSWFDGMRTVDIEAPEAAGNGPAPAPAGACFFSCGVDSFYSLLKDIQRPADQRRFSHLAWGIGLDLRPGQDGLIRGLRDQVESVARETGLGAVRFSMNLRDFTDRWLDWDTLHGAALAAAGHLLSGAFGRIAIPSSMSYATLQPYGSHSLLDPLWSGSSLDLAEDGAELSRVDKVCDWIARSPLALRHLRVCWENRDGKLNCGVCEKCVRTKLALYAVGALDGCATLGGPLTPRQVFAATWPIASGNYVHATENLHLLRLRGGPGRTGLAAALFLRIAMVRTLLAWRVWTGRFGVVTVKPPVRASLDRTPGNPR
jgi:hypothetical protein